MWGPNEIPAACAVLAEADVLIGHNIIRYDLPVLEKIEGFRVAADVEILDTLVLARLIFPNVRDTDGALLASGRMPTKGSDDKKLKGSHKLEAWGYRLGENKAHYEGTWEVWTQAMQDYMVQDVCTNVALWRHLQPDAYSQLAVKLEHRIARLCDDIEREGVPFNIPAAGALHAELMGKKETIEDALKAQFGSWRAPFSPTPARREFTPKRDNKKQGYIAGAPFSKLKVVDFNPGSRAHITKVLVDRGWKPSEFTEGGQAKVDEGIVGGLVGMFPEVSGLADYLMIDKRLSQLADGDQAWLQTVKEDGHIHGVINPMGTTTSRASHFFPNLGQVPSPKKPYGIECRRLFGHKPGWKLVGADMEGLELRGLAHYLAMNDGGKYADVVLAGDPHWLHAGVMGLVEMGAKRDKHSQLHTVVREDGSKRFIYAYIYGCGDTKAGEIIHACLMNAYRTCGDEGVALYKEFFGDKLDPGARKIAAVGKTVRARFLERIEGFDTLKKKIARQVDRCGWVPGLDGRRIPVRSEHAALNFMIQSAGAILCKRWGCDAVDDLASKFKLGWSGEVVPVLWVHDEYQVACREGLEDEVGQILVKHAQTAGEPYAFRVKLDSKYTFGDTWADTH